MLSGTARSFKRPYARDSRKCGRAGEVYRYLRDQGVKYTNTSRAWSSTITAVPYPFSITGPQYGDFLCELFDEWLRSDTRTVSVRLFDSIVNLMATGIATSCHLGSNCRQYFVVDEYNGDVYPCDFFVGTRPGSAASTSSRGRSSTSRRRMGSSAAQDPVVRGLQGLRGQMAVQRRLPEIPRRRDRRRQTKLAVRGWKQFYRHSLPAFQRLAAEVKRG